MFKITSIGGKPNSYSQKEYLLTNISDLDKLPKYGIRGTLNDPNDSVVDEPCATEPPHDTLSPIRPTGIPLTKTVEEPDAIAPECGIWIIQP